MMGIPERCAKRIDKQFLLCVLCFAISKFSRLKQIFGRFTTEAQKTRSKVFFD